MVKVLLKLDLICALFAFIFLLVSGLYLSHRVAGPLGRLKNEMDGVASGKTPGVVKFRKKDFFQDLAASFNRQTDALTKHT